MNHGGVGYVEGYELFLPDDLLRPLSIIHHTELFGIYYPKPRANDLSYIEHDLMITPVPYLLWPKIGHYLLRLHHRPHSILEVSRVLADLDVSILLAEVTRDGHRYDTWNLTVAFDFLAEPDNLTFDDNESCYIETSSAINRTAEILRERCVVSLFCDARDANLREPVTAVNQTALAYFYEFTKNARSRPDAYLYAPFTLRYDSTRDSLRDFGDKEFKNVLDHIWGDADAAERRAIVPASVESGDINIRAVIVPPNQEGRFFEGRIEYFKPENPHTRGLLAHYLDKMGHKQNIWRLFNHTKVHRERREEGSITVVFEDLFENASSTQRLNFARRSFDRMRNEPLPDELRGVTTTRAEVFPLSPARVRTRFRIERERQRAFRNDVFISFASCDAEHVDKLKSILDEVGVTAYKFQERIEAGRDYREKIRQELRSSMDFCIIISNASLRSDEVRLEWGAAWGLGMRIVPVLVNVELGQLPSALRHLDCVSLLKDKEVRKYAEDLAERADSISHGFLDVLDKDFL